MIDMFVMMDCLQVQEKKHPNPVPLNL